MSVLIQSLCLLRRADLIFVVESVGHDHSTSAVNLGYVASCVPKTEASWLSSNRMAITNSGTIFGRWAWYCSLLFLLLIFDSNIPCLLC